jgi:metallo-beta-lactamase family protein
MKVKFCGGINQVTGSCTHLHYGATDTQFLVDCGMVQGTPHSDFENGKAFPFNPVNLKFVLLTHAHLDHCGLIPRLYREGFSGQVFCTRATARIAREVMLDSARIGEGRLYSENDVKNVKFYHLDDRKNFKWGKWLPIDQDLNVFAHRSAHILGSCGMGISWKVGQDGTGKAEIQSMLFSGDIGPSTEEVETSFILKDTMSPYSVTNYLIMESTKGALQGAKTITAKDRLAELRDLINAEVFDKKRKLVVAAFSVHRMQEILYDLVLLAEQGFDCELPDDGRKVHVGCESALGKVVSNIYAEELFAKVPTGKNMYFPGDEDERVNKVFRQVLKRKQKFGPFRFDSWTGVNRRPNYGDEPSIVISSSGMCEKGAIERYLKRALFDEEFTLVLTGYQSMGTNGCELMKLLNDPEYEGVLSLCGERYSTKDVKARIVFLEGYSGHASPDVMMNDWLTRLKPDANKAVFLNHGSSAARTSLKKQIQSSLDPVVRSRNIILPECTESYVLTKAGAERVEEQDPQDSLSEESYSKLCDIYSTLEQENGMADQESDRLPAADMDEMIRRIHRHLNNAA